MKTVIFVSDLTLWSMGHGNGGPAFTKTINKYIDEGIEVYLISDVEENREFEGIDSAHNIIVRPSFAKSFVNIQKLGVVFRYIDHRIISKRFEKEIIKIIENSEQSLLYAYEIYGVRACKRISKRYNIPYVTRFQGTILSQYKDNLVNRVKRYPHYQALSQKSDLVIMTDDGTQGDRVLNEVKNSSERLFLRNGLDLISNSDIINCFSREEFRNSICKDISQGECVFLTVSRLVSWKKIDRAIKGFYEYIKKGGSGRLVIVGDGNEKEKLYRLTQSLGVDKQVYFMGAVNHDEVYKYMLSSDVFLSLYDLSNVGNPLLEAMTLGCCIVTLDVGDTNQIITNGENGILLKREEIDSLGDTLYELSHNERKRIFLGRNARDYAQKHFYDWDKRMEIEYGKVMSLYH